MRKHGFIDKNMLIFLIVSLLICLFGLAFMFKYSQGIGFNPQVILAVVSFCLCGLVAACIANKPKEDIFEESEDRNEKENKKDKNYTSIIIITTVVVIVGAYFLYKNGYELSQVLDFLRGALKNVGLLLLVFMYILCYSITRKR